MSDVYAPQTARGGRYRMAGYWFATGWWFAQDGPEFTPDFSFDFSMFAARIADRYEREEIHSMHSIPDMWNDYLDQIRSLA
jgi:hypothetical protein